MKLENGPHGLSKTALAALLFSFLSYSQALSQNLGDKPVFRVIAYKQTPVDTARVTVQPGSATGFMGLLRELGISNEVIVLQAGVGLQTALEEHFPTYEKVITPGTKLMYIPNTAQVVVTFPDNNTLTATIAGTAKKPQVSVAASTQEPKKPDALNNSANNLLIPETYSTTSTRLAAPAPTPTAQRGILTQIGAAGVGAALKSTILQDYHELPAASIANQAGLFIHNNLATIVGDTLPNNLYIQTIRDNSIGGLRVYITQKTFKVEKTKTGTFKSTGSGKQIPVYKTTKTPVSTRIAEYGITHEGTSVNTYIIPITE